VGLDAEEPLFYKKDEIIHNIICPDSPSHDTVFAGVDECYQPETVLVSEFVSSTTELAFSEDNVELGGQGDLMVANVGASRNVFTDATLMVNVVPKNNTDGICVDDDGVIWHDDTGDHLIKFLSMNDEVNDVGPIIQSVGDECKVMTKVTGGKLDVQGEFKLPKATGGMTAVPGKSLHAYEYVIMQNLESKEDCGDVGTMNFDYATFERHGKWFHGVDDYYKKWRCPTDPKKEGVTGLVIFGPLDGFTDGDEPVIPFPTTI
jgi:hypothetical protein